MNKLSQSPPHSGDIRSFSSFLTTLQSAHERRQQLFPLHKFFHTERKSFFVQFPSTKAAVAANFGVVVVLPLPSKLPNIHFFRYFQLLYGFHVAYLSHILTTAVWLPNAPVFFFFSHQFLL